MVDRPDQKAWLKWVTGHVMRYHLGWTRHSQTDTDWTPRRPALAQERQITILALGALGAGCGRDIWVSLGFNVTGWSRRPKGDFRRNVSAWGRRAKRCPTQRRDRVLLLPNTLIPKNTLNAETLSNRSKGAFY